MTIELGHAAPGRTTVARFTMTALFGAFLLTLPLPQSAGGQAVAEAAEVDGSIDVAVRSAAAAIDAAWDAGDAQAFAGVWTEDGVVISPMGELTEGRSNIRAAMAAQFAGPLKGTTHKLDVKHVYDVRAGVAVADGEATVHAPDGTPWTAQFSAVFMKDDAGRWLVDYMTSYVYIPR
jgi:uncharacterized protein (TIGR02246 family)